MPKVVVIGSRSGPAGRVIEALRGSEFSATPAEDVLRALELTREGVPDTFICFDEGLSLKALDLVQLTRSDKRFERTTIIAQARGKAAEEALLQAGCDEILAEGSPEEVLQLLKNHRADASARKRVGLEGDLSQVNLLDIVQMLLASRRDGVLQLRLGARSGDIVFRVGQIVSANFEKESGDEALLEILKTMRNSGSFTFSAEDTSAAKQTIFERTEHILVSLANVIDEGK